MAIRKAGSRKIEVDGQPYLWRVRHRDPEADNRGWEWGLAIQHASSPGSTLIVRLGRRHPRWATTVAPVVPSEVAYFIRKALLGGWKPTQRGSAFEFVDESGADLT